MKRWCLTSTATNTGNVTLDVTGITDTMTNLDSTVLAGTLTGPVPAGSELIVGAELRFGNYAIPCNRPILMPGGIENTATIAASTPAGGVVNDTSDDGDDGDGNVSDDPTVAAIQATESVIATKIANTPTRIRPDVFVVTFTHHG